MNKPMNYLSILRYSAVALVVGAFLMLGMWSGGKTVPQSSPTPGALLPAGHTSRITLRDAGLKLAQKGVMDQEKVAALYGGAEQIPVEIQEVLSSHQSSPMHVTHDNAGHYLNVLWAVGLANQMAANEASPVNGDNRYRLASTGGWTLGKAENGGEYFNQYPIVFLTPEQEELVVRLAKQMYRPCCNNHTFFQDCNHGSALLGLLQLGVTQGLSEAELYREALAFNALWFPQQYAELAVYFSEIEGILWPEVDPKIALSAPYSSSQGWQQNVHAVLQERSLLPQVQSSSGCGVSS